jgi:hypothetical protein
LKKIHDDAINFLNAGANPYIPRLRKNFNKFRWDQELGMFKTAAIEIIGFGKLRASRKWINF